MRTIGLVLLACMLLGLAVLTVTAAAVLEAVARAAGG